MRRLELVAVLNLQNATGSNEPDDLAKLIDWYTRPDVVELLNSYQDMLLINLANEWYGSWEDPQDLYTQSYLREITRIRGAGLSHTLIVDARGWGQQFSSILDTYEAFQMHDSNLLFSSHMYDIFNSDEVVESAFRSARDKKIPLIIGEFGCSHYPGQEVACSAIMKNAEQSDHKYGYIAWSFSGNSNPLDGLDLFLRSDWTTLSSYGDRIVNTDPDGIVNTSMVACLFPGQFCEGEVE
jgi:mannan endo-1,4-beta-mannosidase